MIENHSSEMMENHSSEMIDNHSSDIDETKDEKKNNENLILNFKTTPRKSEIYSYTMHKWDLTNQVNADKFLKETNYNFEKGGWIQEDKSITCGFKICVNDKFRFMRNIIYLMVISGKIIKGGKSKNPLKERSYGAGTEKSWTETGKASETNYVFSQIFRECIKKNIPVIFYICEVPKKYVEYITSEEGSKNYIEISPYEEMEKTLNAHLNKVMGRKIIGDGDLMNIYKK